MNVHGRHIRQAQWLISIEIGLIDQTIGQCDFVAQRGPKAKADAAFDLRLDHIGIDRNPAVHAKLGELLAAKIKSDTTGRHSTVVTKEEIDMIEGDDFAVAGKGFDVEEA